MNDAAPSPVRVVVFYVGSSILAPLRRAESEIREHGLELNLAAHNGGAAWSEPEWEAALEDLAGAHLVLVMHLTDSDNSRRLLEALDRFRHRHHAVIVFNCLADLMGRTRMGKLDLGRLMATLKRSGRRAARPASGLSLAHRLGTWMSELMSRRTASRSGGGAATRGGRFNAYHKLAARLPGILKFVPGAGKLRDIKNYLILYCHFLQPTPKNIRSMLLHAVKHYVPGHATLASPDPPEVRPSTGLYHPLAPELFESFSAYRDWYRAATGRSLDPRATVGLLLMRPQIVGEARRHYDGLIRAIESEGLSVVAAISTFMDNREACRAYFLEEGNGDPTPSGGGGEGRPGPRVSQVVSLTGFSFVGGPVMNDTDASVEFLRELGVPFRSLVSLDLQTIENWEQSRVGLNPVQTAMQVAIPELDGATESRLFGGVRHKSRQPEPLTERCRLIAARLAGWNRLQTAPRHGLKLALVIFCFPPNKGNLGTAADLDVFASLLEVLTRLRAEGYDIPRLQGPEELRRQVLEGNSQAWGTVANVAYRMPVEEYRSLCPHVAEIEREWGPAPGVLNASGRELMILGARLGNAFIGVQPGFGYEGDPMRMLAAQGGAPHHGFMALYSYLQKVYRADALIHVGTHGAAEFMPGKQVGLSSGCWPDRLLGAMPHLYLYSVNNPSEGTIAKRRTSAELVSYLTPPLENAGLYKGLVSMKELLSAYRNTPSESEKRQLYASIEEQSRALNLS